MEYISLFGVIISIALFAYFSFKGLPVYVCGVVFSIVMWGFDCISGGTLSFNEMLKIFSNSAGEGVTKYMLLFFSSALLGKLVESTGIAGTIGDKITNIVYKAPKKYQKFLGALCSPIFAAIFTYCGVSVFVIAFAVVAITKDVFKRLDIPWRLYLSSTLGAAIGNVILPGAVTISNITPTQYLGTSVKAAPVLAIIATIITIIITYFWLTISIKRAEKKGEGFFPTGTEIDQQEVLIADHSPVNLYIGIPLLLSPVILLNTTSLSAEASILIGDLILILAYHKRTFPLLKDIVLTGFKLGISPTISLACAMGFASTVLAMRGMTPVMNGLVSLPIPAHVKLALVTAVSGIMLGSSIPAITTGFEVLGTEYLLTSGIPLEALHRISCIASLGASMPHSSGVCSNFIASKISQKDGYSNYFMSAIVLNVIATTIICIWVSLGLPC